MLQTMFRPGANNNGSHSDSGFHTSLLHVVLSICLAIRAHTLAFLRVYSKFHLCFDAIHKGITHAAPPISTVTIVLCWIAIIGQKYVNSGPSSAGCNPPTLAYERLTQIHSSLSYSWSSLTDSFVYSIIRKVKLTPITYKAGSASLYIMACREASTHRRQVGPWFQMTACFALAWRETNTKNMYKLTYLPPYMCRSANQPSTT